MKNKVVVDGSIDIEFDYEGITIWQGSDAVYIKYTQAPKLIAEIANVWYRETEGGTKDVSSNFHNPHAKQQTDNTGT